MINSRRTPIRNELSARKLKRICPRLYLHFRHMQRVGRKPRAYLDRFKQPFVSYLHWSRFGREYKA